MVLNRVVGLFVSSLLNKFVVIDPSQVKISNGIELSNLSVRLPVGKGFLKSIRVENVLNKQPLLVHANGIRIVLHESPSQEEEDRINSAPWYSKDADQEVEEDSKERISQYLTNIQLKLTDITIEYDCVSTLESHGKVRISIDRIDLFNMDAEWQVMKNEKQGNTVRKLLRIENLCVFIQSHPQTSIEESLVFRANISVKVLLSYNDDTTVTPDIDFQVQMCASSKDEKGRDQWNKEEQSRGQEDVFHDAEENESPSPLMGSLSTPVDNLGAKDYSTCWFDGCAQDIRPHATISKAQIDVLGSVVGSMDLLRGKDSPSSIHKAAEPSYGYASWLNFAKDWILSEIRLKVDPSDEDDEDVFEDAISPPSLSVSCTLQSGFCLDLKTDDRGGGKWRFEVERSTVKWKQSVVEDEVLIHCDGVQGTDLSDPTNVLSVIRSEVQSCETVGLQQVFQFHCIYPSKESRRVGYQPVVSLKVATLYFMIDRMISQQVVGIFEALTELLSCGKELQPTPNSSFDGTAVKPISEVSIEIQALRFKLSVNARDAKAPSLHLAVDDVRTSTSSVDTEVCATTIVGCVKLSSTLRPMQSIVQLEPIQVSVKSKTRMEWAAEDVVCRHRCSQLKDLVGLCPSTALKKPNCLAENEQATYYLQVVLPILSLECSEEELNTLFWIIGQWTKVNTPNNESHPSFIDTTQMWSEWKVDINCPSVQLKLLNLPRIESTDNDNVRATDENSRVVSGLSVQSQKLSISIQQCSQVIQVSFLASHVQVVDDTGNELICVTGSHGSEEYGVELSYISCPRKHALNDEKDDVEQTEDFEMINMFVGDVKIVTDLAILTFFINVVSIAMEGMLLASHQLPPNTTGGSDRVEKLQSSKDRSLCSQFNASMRSVEVTLQYEHEKVATLRSGRSSMVFQYFDSRKCCSECSSMDVRCQFSHFSLTDETLVEGEPHRNAIEPRCTTQPSGTVLDVAVSSYCTHAYDSPLSSPIIQIRVENASWTYLQRFFKEVFVYLTEHLLTSFGMWRINCRSTLEEMLSKYGLSCEGTMETYLSERFESDAPKDGPGSRLELVLSNFRYILPVSTLSEESIVLESPFVKLWTIDSEFESNPNQNRNRRNSMDESAFLTVGLFPDENRAGISQCIDSLVTEGGEEERRSLATRIEYLRSVRREARKQRARMNEKRSSLLSELRISEQELDSFQHQGLEVCESVKDSVETIKRALAALDMEVSMNSQTIQHYDAQIQQARSEGISQPRSVHMVDSLPLPNYPSRKDLYENSLSSLSDISRLKDAKLAVGHKSESKFGQMSAKYSAFAFEAVDVVGCTVVDETQASFIDRNQVRGKVFYSDHSVEKSTTEESVAWYPLLVVEVLMDEFTVTTDESQYSVLLGIIMENFKEKTVVVPENLPEPCHECGGCHFDDQQCDSAWLYIPIKASVATLYLQNGGNEPSKAKKEAIAQANFEELMLSFCLRTTDVVQIRAQADTMAVWDQHKNQGEDEDKVNNAASVRMGRQILQPLDGDGPQVVFLDEMSWTRTRLELQLNNSCITVKGDTMASLQKFFVEPFRRLSLVIERYFLDDVLDVKKNPYLEPPRTDLPAEEMAFEVDVLVDKSLFCLLEDMENPSSRALVVSLRINYNQIWLGWVDDGPESIEMHVSIDQKGVFFACIPISENYDRLNVPLSNPFTIQFDYIYSLSKSITPQGSTLPQQRNQRLTLVVHPIEVHVSMQDLQLLSTILTTVTHSLSNSMLKKDDGDEDEEDEEESDEERSPGPSPTSSSHSLQSSPSLSSCSYIVNDQALGQFGNLRIVLVNNSLGIPLLDAEIRNISAEYQHNGDALIMSLTGTLSSRYFNNKIYRWEPFIEPFEVQAQVVKDQKSAQHVKVNCTIPRTVNINLTTAFSPILALDTWQADFASTGDSTAPFWLLNRTGCDLRFSFRKGKGRVSQQRISNLDRIPLIRRGEDDLTHFDVQNDIFAEFQNETFTASHTLFLWLNGTDKQSESSLEGYLDGKYRDSFEYCSAHPVIVDVTGSFSIPLERRGCASDQSELPMLVMDITLQEDGSKLIDVHSHVLVRNLSTVPLQLWMYSRLEKDAGQDSERKEDESEAGVVTEWKIERNESCFIPLHLARRGSRLSIRPNMGVAWGAVESSSFEETNKWEKVDESSSSTFLDSSAENRARVRKRKKDLLSDRICVCAHTREGRAFGRLSSDEHRMKDDENSLVVENEDLMNVVPSLPNWQCSYYSESSSIRQAPMEMNSVGVVGLESKEDPSEEEDEKDDPVVFSARNNHHMLNRHLDAIQHNLQEAGEVKRFHMQNSESFLHVITLQPALTMQSRLASPVAYRVLNKSLQLVAEGIIGVGEVLPLFQLDLDESILVSFRVENYLWSAPRTILNPSDPNQRIPFRERVERVIMKGREFGGVTIGAAQADVPDLEVRVKLEGRSVLLYSPIWIVNHTNLTLEYVNTSQKNLQLVQSMKRYTHTRPASFVFDDFAGQRKSDGDFGEARNCDFEVKSTIELPVALLVNVLEARKLYEGQFFGTQSPFVVVRMFQRHSSNPASQQKKMAKKAVNYDKEVGVYQTHPSSGGGLNPKWTSMHHNSLYCPIPGSIRKSSQCYLLVEVRNSFYGSERVLGEVKLELSDITANPDSTLEENWYSLVRFSKKRKTKEQQGELKLTIAVGSRQNISESNSLASKKQTSLGKKIPHSVDSDPHRNSLYEPARSRNGHSSSSSHSNFFRLEVFLPHNRFFFVSLWVHVDMTASELIERTAEKAGLSIYDASNYVLHELKKPRFVSLRSAGRPEAETWWGSEIALNDAIGTKGRSFGLHLSHRVAMTTLRSYDDGSTASSHHMTPKSSSFGRVSNRKPRMWGEAVMFGSGGGGTNCTSWDHLRVRVMDSTWSDSVRITRNAIGNSGVAQVLQMTEEKYGTRTKERQHTPSRMYDLAFWSEWGSGTLLDTIVCTIVPRYVLINRTSSRMKYSQAAMKEDGLDVGQVKALYWPDAASERMIRVNCGGQDWKWSSKFSLDAVGTLYIKLRSRDKAKQQEIYILQCHVELLGGSIVCIFQEEVKRWPPYRIDNQTSFRIAYAQDCGAVTTSESFDVVPPHSSAPYAWEDLSAGTKLLLVRFRHQGEAPIDSIASERGYNLDEMMSHKDIRLQRSLPSFLKCEREGFIMKRDGILRKWTNRYFRLKDGILYYFLSPDNWELRGIIDLCARNDSDESKVKITLKGGEPSSGGGLESKHNTGSDVHEESGKNRDLRAERQAMNVARLLAKSEYLLEEMESKARREEGEGTRTPSSTSRKMCFLGATYMDALQMEQNVPNRDKARQICQKMLVLGAFERCGDELSTTPNEKFQEDVMYSFVPLNIGDRVPSSSSVISSLPVSKEKKGKKSSSKNSTKKKRSREFMISTGTRVYQLRTDSYATSVKWVQALRDAAMKRGTGSNASMFAEEEVLATPKDGELKTKTTVRIRVRADGPTKVLELTECGAEDGDDLVPSLRRERSLHKQAKLMSASSATGASISASNRSFWSDPAVQITTSVYVCGVGVSVVNEEPMELIYCFLSDLQCSIVRQGKRTSSRMTVTKLQVDNQTEDSTFPTILFKRQSEKEEEEEQEQTRMISGESVELQPRRRRPSGITNTLTAASVCASCNMVLRGTEFHFCCVYWNEPGNTFYFEHSSIWLHPLEVQVDEELITMLRAFRYKFFERFSEKSAHFREKSSSVDRGVLVNVTQHVSNDYQAIVRNQDLDPLNLEHVAITRSSDKEGKVYFALLQVNAMELDITIRSDMLSHSTHEAIQSTAAGWTSSLSLPDLDNAPIRLNALLIEHAFGTGGDLVRRVSKHYTRQLWKQVHKVLGSLDFLGNPVGFLDHIGTGVKDFFYEPIEGLKDGRLGKGFAKGTSSLVSNTVGGTFNAASKISGTFGEGLASLSLDDHYQLERAKARRKHVRNVREGVAQGAREFGIGVYEGISGIVMAPYRGAVNHGTVGFVKGAFSGIIGVPLKPVAGVFDFASRASQGVRNKARNRIHEGDRVSRIRPPRVFGRYNQLRVFKLDDAVACDILKRASGGRLANEQILFYFEVVETLATSEMVAHSAKHVKTRSGSRRASEDLDEIYSVHFEQKSLGLQLETDFYGENVVVKRFSRNVHEPDENLELISSGDVLLGINGVEIDQLDFESTMNTLRCATRPVNLQFRSIKGLRRRGSERNTAPTGSGLESGSETQFNSTHDPNSDMKMLHWVIVTEQRILHINVANLYRPVIEWTTPARYVRDVDLIEGSAINLQLRVGVNSLPSGPLLRPSAKKLTYNRNMERFRDVMSKSFHKEAIAEDQELWPSDTTNLGGYLVRRGTVTNSKRYFVLSRHCLYQFQSNKCRRLQGILPLGSMVVERDSENPLFFTLRRSRTTAASRMETPSMPYIQMENSQAMERSLRDMQLISPNIEEAEMWISAISHAGGMGMRNSRGARNTSDSSASYLRIGCNATQPHVVSALFQALKKWQHIFSHSSY